MSVVDGLIISPTPLAGFPKQLLANWDRKVEIETAYLTAINTQDNGKEKRKGLKVRPRRFIFARLTGMDQRELAQLRNFQMRTANQVVPYPIYCDITRITFASNVFTGDFTNTRFFVGARLIHFAIDYNGVSEVSLYVITNVTDTEVTVSTSIADLGANTNFIAPLIDADIELKPAKETVLSDNKMTVDVNVNEKMDESGLIPLPMTGFSPAIYAGRPIFPFEHNWLNDVSLEILRFGTRIEFGRGRLISVDSLRPQVAIGQKSLFDRQEAFEFLQWFDYCRGRLVPFWVGNPSSLWEVVSIGATTITVKGYGLDDKDITDFYAYIRGVGDSTVMKIDSVAVVGDDLEITSSEVPPGLDVTKIQPMHLVRFGKDSIREVWTNRDVCEISYELVELLEGDDTPTAYIISGTVSGDIISNARIDLTGDAAAIAYTNISGDYSFSVLPGDYNVAPNLPAFDFVPTDRDVTVVDLDVPNQDFVASTPSLFTVSGTVTGAVVENVLINLTGDAISSALTDINGDYSFELAPGDYTLTPVLATYGFTPVDRDITVVAADVLNQDFVSGALVDQWKTCVGDVDVAQLTPGHTDVDFAWLCVGGFWSAKAYNSGQVLGSVDDPTVLKQCGVPAPIDCADLIGWRASDEFDNTNACNSQSKTDDNAKARWTFTGESGITYNAGDVDLSLTMTGSFTQTSFAQNTISHPGDFTLSLPYNSLVSPNTGDSSILMTISIGGSFYFIQRANFTGSHRVQWGVPSSGSSNISAGTHLSGTLIFTRTGTTLTAKIGSTTYKTWTGVSGTVTRFSLGLDSGSGSGTVTATITGVSMVDGSSNDIYTDPEGQSC